MPLKSSSARLSFTVTRVRIPYFKAEPTTVKWGSKVRHEATLADEFGSTYIGYRVQFQWFYGGAWRTVCEAVVDSAGYARCEWTVPYSETVRIDGLTSTIKFPCNRFKVRAYSPDFNVASHEVTVEVYSETRVEASTNKKSYAPSEDVVVTGRLLELTPTGTAGLANMTLTIMWWDRSRTTVTTGSDGGFTATKKAPTTSGTYTITIEFAGAGFSYTSLTLGFNIGGGDNLSWLALAVASLSLIGVAYARRKRLI
jgi:hypothetical protein